MRRVEACEALVLKTYDIGDADRLCVLLTSTRGRLPVIAKGVRKLGSRWGNAMLSFQHLSLELSSHSSGWYLHSARLLSSYPLLRKDVSRFVLASRGAELLLHFLHDTELGGEMFSLARDYFTACNDTNLQSKSGIAAKHRASPVQKLVTISGALNAKPYEGPMALLFPTFQLSLLSALGLLPVFTEQTPPSPWSLKGASSALTSYLQSRQSLSERASVSLDAKDRNALQHLCDALLREHLSFPLKSFGVW